MNPLDLDVPATAPPHREYSVAGIQAAFESLPKLNEQQAFDAVYGLLGDLNRTVLAPALRFELAECALEQVEFLTDNLCRRCEHLEFPVPEPEQAYVDRVQQLLAVAATAYKQVVVDLVDRPLDAAGQALLQHALLRTARLLALRVLQAYSVYAPVPAGVWGELHRIYRYAEQVDVALIRVEHLADQSIGDVYKRALLVALANPYHLMQGEARLTDERLAKWALACRLSHPNEYPPENPQTFYRGRFHVDLAGDGPPVFGLIGGRDAPRDARLLDLKPVAAIAEDGIRKLTLRGKLTIRERLERDLLRRLRNAWTGRAERAAPRDQSSREVQIVGGLRACHFAIAGGAEFHPEQDEVALHGSDFKAADEALSLVPLEDEPWRQDDARGKLEQGLIKPRSYGFDVESREDDVWERSARVGVRRSTRLEEQLDLRAIGRRGRVQQRDASPTGIGARCPGDSTLRFRVGDLVGIAEETEPGAREAWRIGVVCWLRMQAEGGLSLGLRRVEGAPAAVAARGLEGTGAGGEYHRVLWMQRSGQNALMVAAGTFDVGAMVLVNTGSGLAACRLARVLQSTKGFTEYLVEPVELTPVQRQEVINSLYQVLDRAT